MRIGAASALEALLNPTVSRIARSRPTTVPSRIFLLALVVAASHGRPSQAQPPVREARDTTAPPRSWWQWLQGAREPDRLFGGMWTLHFQRPEDGLSQHGLVAVSWRGVYAATFVSSHDRRCVGVALARSVLRASRGDGEVSLGYRVGLVYGYDERLLDIAGRVPVLPAGELVAAARYRRIGVMASWPGVVAYLTAFASLGAP